MINSDLLDFSNSNLLDNTIVGKSTVNFRRRGHGKRRGHGRGRHRKPNFSNAGGGGNVDYGAIATATAGLASTLASRQPNTAKQAAKAVKKENKSVCGRRPLLKKKRATWDKCVADYMKSKNPTTTPVDSSESYKTEAPPSYSPPPSDNYNNSSDDKKKKSGDKILGMPKNVAIPVIVGVVAIAGFFVYKQFFAKGVAAAAPAVGV